MAGEAVKRAPLTDAQIELLADGCPPGARELVELENLDTEEAVTSMAQEIRELRKRARERVDAIMGPLR